MKAIAQVFVLDVAAKALAALSTILVIRHLAVPEYARYTLGVSVAGLTAQTLATSFNRIYVVGYERLGMAQAPGGFLGLQLLFVGALAVAALPLAAGWGLLVPATLFVVLGTMLTESARTVHQRELRFGRYSMVELARAALTTAGVAALFAAGRPVRAEHVLTAQGAVLVLVFAVNGGRSSLRGVMEVHAGARMAGMVLRGGYRLLFAYFFAQAVLAQMDVFFLKGLATPEDLATYGAAFRYYLLLSLALASVHAVLFPILQQVRDAAEERAILARHFRSLVLFAPLVLGGAWAAQWLIPLLDGGRYPGAVAIFRVLSLSAILSFAFSPFVHVLMRREDFRFLVWLTLGGMALHAGLNLLLVPRMGAMGAAWATLVGFGLINFSVFLRARTGGGPPVNGVDVAGVPGLPSGDPMLAGEG